MAKKYLKKAGVYFLLAFGTYLVMGNLLHHVVFPEQKPDVKTYFKPGQQFYSKTEGFRQKILGQSGGYVHGTLEIEPFAGGPPMHIHSDFDETFSITNGELSIWVNGELKKLKPGQEILIPKGTPHKPFNETADTIHLKGSFAFPEKFAFGLTQVYAMMDENPDFKNSPSTPIQMAMMTTAGFDSYMSDGPPMMVQKIMAFIVAPAARLFGFKSYYEKYDPFL
jgi:mannose-6-phosphate isomerase-like protein (cupin superfamily)